MNRNIGCSIAAVLMIITMLATGCGTETTAGNTGRTKVDVAASATSGATTEALAATGIADTAASDNADTAATDSGNTASTDSGNIASTAEETESGNAAGADDFIGIYQGMDGGPSCNIWEQSTGLMIGGSLAIGSDYYGSAEYSDGKLYFDFTDEISGKSYQGEIEKTQDGIRMTISNTDDANVPAGSVFELPNIG